MKADASSKVTINAGKKNIFKYLVDLKYHQLWNPHLQKIRPITILRQEFVYKTTSLMLGVRVTGKNKVVK